MKIKRKHILSTIILCFFIVSIYPNVGLRFETVNSADIKSENRNITPIPEGTVTNKKFYEQLEMWYQDRLALRVASINAWWKWNKKIFGILRDKDKILNEGWILSKQASIRDFKEKDLKIARLSTIQQYCEAHGTEFIVLIAPDKETVYREKFPSRFRDNTPNPVDFHHEFSVLCENNNINYVNVTDELMAAKAIGDDLYFRDDHHWSYYGSAIASDKLLKKISDVLHSGFYQGMLLDGSVREAFKERSYAESLMIPAEKSTMAPWSNKFTDEIYQVDYKTGEEHKLSEPVSNNLLWSHLVNDEGIIVNKSINNNVAVLVLGDSYSSYMAPYITQNIHTWISTHYRDHRGEKKNTDLKHLIDKYHPDIVVLEMVETGFFSVDGSKFLENISL